MQLRYLPWAVAGGTCVTLVPGSALWVVPLAGALIHMAYDVEPEAFRNGATAALTAIKRLPLPTRLLPDQGTDDEGIDEQEDRALAATALAMARQRVADAPSDTKAQQKLDRLEGQARAIYPDLVGDVPTRAPIEADAFSQELARVQAPTKERDPLLQMLEAEPHQLVIGHTRGGKTTLMHEMATHWADEGERVVVCDPDAMPGLWPGCTVVGHGNDTEKIQKVIHVTWKEFGKREQARGQGQRTFDPIRLVIDEAHLVMPKILYGVDIVEELARRGAKHGIFLTVGVQDKMVGTLGMEGKSEVLKNFITVDVLKDGQGQRQAVIKDAVTGKKVAHRIPQLRDPESLIIQPQPQPVVVARVAAQPTTAALGETERLPKRDVSPEQASALLAAMMGGEPPKQETATATIKHDGLTINIDARASAEQPTADVSTARNRPAGADPNIRQKAQRMIAARQARDLRRTYARLAHLVFDDAWEQAGKKPGNRNAAHKLWKEARNG